MPLYDFECKTCGHVFEELIFEEDEKVPCQACQGNDTARKVAAPSPLKTNPFPYKVGKTLPHMSKIPQASALNRTCPKAGSCGATTTFGGTGTGG